MKLCKRCQVRPGQYHCAGMLFCETCAKTMNFRFGTPMTVVGAAASSDVQPASWVQDLILPGLGTSEDVVQRKKKFGAIVSQLDAVVRGSSKIPVDTRTGWNAFGQDFAQWFNSDTSWMTAYDDVGKANDYQSQIRDWQLQISKYANIGMSVLEAPPSLSGSLASVAKTAETTASTVKTALILAGIVGVGVVAYTFYNAQRTGARALDILEKNPGLLVKAGVLA
jgi:hypothetical protein